MVLQLIILIVLLLLSFFYSGLETGIVSLDLLSLEKEAKRNVKKRRLLNFVTKPDRFFGTILIGNNIVNVLIASISTIIAHNSGLFKAEYTSLVIGGVVFIFGEILPKILFRDYSNVVVPKTFPFLRVSFFLLKPFVAVVTWLNDILYKKFKIGGPHSLAYLTKDDLALLLSNTKHDKTISNPQKEMLEDMLEFNELQAEDIMISRHEIVAFSSDTPMSEVIQVAKDKGFTRYPVYEETIDKIVGILIIFDVIKVGINENSTAGEMIHQPYFVPENIDLNILMQDMQNKKKSMVIIVDSFGGTAGIVTFEDIMEEIVGDIEDEFDQEDKRSDVVKLSQDTYLVNGEVEVDDLIDDYGLELPEGSYKTVAGLIIEMLEKVPSEGAKVIVGDFSLQVMQATKRKIVKVKIKIINNKK
ncbi:MAG: hypothetical protein B6226_02540 [Candidatus Cloacimonetes bacterium 4572_65]|nr:MAG: hypothetical protein B6226_02540 [Candidatus Cloacimonetes bacterium 4572_65]